MLTKHFYVRIRRDRIDVRCVETNRNATRAGGPTFSTARLLVGTFSAAGTLLKAAVEECVVASEFIPARRLFVMHPLELSDGGLSEVEHRVLLELAAGAGASRTVVHEGAELSDDGVRAAASRAS
jgi:hypothetical protein